jgi:hypothetical protein
MERPEVDADQVFSYHKCACARDLLDRFWVVLSEARPRPGELARRFTAEHYELPQEVRWQDNHRHRQVQTEVRAERQQEREKPRR